MINYSDHIQLMKNIMYPTAATSTSITAVPATAISTTATISATGTTTISNLTMESSNFFKNFCPYLGKYVPQIIKVEILKENQVIRFTFDDGKTKKSVIKTICKEGDTFDFRFAFFLAYAKYFWKNDLLPSGIEKIAKEYMNVKFMDNMVKKGMKVYFDQKKKEEQEKKAKEESKAIKARRAAKKKAKKTKAKEAEIDKIAAAIKKTKASD